MRESMNDRSEAEIYPVPNFEATFYIGRRSLLFRRISWKRVSPEKWREGVRPFVKGGSSMQDIIAACVYGRTVFNHGRKYFRADLV